MKSNIRIAIVVSNYHKNITDELLRHCLTTLRQRGLANGQITTVRVPGSFEIPLAAKKLAKKKIFDAIIALGVIHKGDTHHFELIANECARGCMQVSLDMEIPIIFEVLAVYKLEDALARATRKRENRGVEAALAALKILI
ncbi:MAG: 6,7-dimethyl-8-ribityllumazine synthase [Patescibacteria group bacterium]